MGFEFFFISSTSSNVSGRGNPTVSGRIRAQRPPTMPKAPNRIIGNFSSTIPVEIRYFPITGDIIPPTLAMVEQAPRAEFLMEVGKIWAVYMYFTFEAADAPNLAPRVRMANMTVPGVRNAATMQQMPGMQQMQKHPGNTKMKISSNTISKKNDFVSTL